LGRRIWRPGRGASLTRTHLRFDEQTGVAVPKTDTELLRGALNAGGGGRGRRRSDDDDSDDGTTLFNKRRRKGQSVAASAAAGARAVNTAAVLPAGASSSGWRLLWGKMSGPGRGERGEQGERKRVLAVHALKRREPEGAAAVEQAVLHGRGLEAVE
jgi:hypothetical protein